MSIPGSASPLFIGAAAGAAAAAFQIDRSLRFNDSDSAHLARTFRSGNPRKWTWSCWVKRNKFGGYQTLFGHVSGTSGQHYIDFGSDKIRFTRYVSSNEAALETSAVYRDPSAWYHIVAVWDTDNATANHRQRLYVNGVEVTDFSTRVNPSQYYSGVISTAIEHNISKVLSQNYGAFQLAEMHFIDGQALAPTDFGEYDSNDVWQAKNFEGTYNGSASGNYSSDATLSGDTPDSGRPLSNLFNGQLDDNGFGTTISGSGDTTATWSTAIPTSGTVRIRGSLGGTSSQVGGNTGFIEVNGTDLTSSFKSANGYSSRVWVDITSITSSGISTIKVKHISGSGYPSVTAIEVDGDYLIEVPAGVNGFHLDFSDNSSDAALGTDSSGVGTTLPGVDFDGSGDYLQLANSNDFDLGSNNFTWECFAYVDDLDTGTPQWFFSVFSSSSGDNAWGLRLEGDGRLYAYLSSDGSESPTTIGPTLANSGMSDKKWHHLAVVRNGSGSNNITVYVDGTSRATGSFTGSVKDTSLPLQIGRQGSSSYTQYLDGKISNLRIINGTALYTANFSTPATPLTNVTNTKLLCCQSSTSATAAAVAPGTITAYGNASATSTQDTDWTVNNLTGFLSNPDVSIANATGALPIRNTTGTYGGTVATGNRTDSQSGLQLAMPLRNGVNDESGNSYTITNTGVTFTTDHSKFYGQSAAFFDSDKVNISNSSGLGSFGTGDFTVEAYVKFTDNGHYYGRVIEFGSVNSNAFVVDGTTAPFRLRYDAGSTTVYGTSGTIPLGKWTHIAAVRSSGTLKFYVDGVEGGSHSFTHNLSGGSAQIGNYLGSQLDFDGYMQDLRVYSSAKYTSNFTPPNDPANSLPGEGLDSLIDTPTNYTATSGNNGGNYATLNAAFGTVTGSTNTPTDGSLTVVGGSSANFSPTTIPVSSGKWYVEVTVAGSGNSSTVGIWKMPMTYGTNYYQNENYRYYQQDGKIYNESGATSYTYNTYAAGDVIGIALDMDNGKVFFSKNGTFPGSSDPVSGTNPPASGLSGTWAIALQAGASTSHTLHLNAGQRSFSYSAPSGFKALCTTNLTTPMIADGSTAFDTKLWTGTGAARSITGYEFSPDFVWIKGRGNATWHELVDIIRGPGERLFSNEVDAETSSTINLTSFNSDGFSLGSENGVNGSGRSYVGWAWDAGTSTVSNTDGSITSSVRASQTNGFSVFTYTGTGTAGTAGHGLNTAPEFYILKSRSDGEQWAVYHKSITALKKLVLNSTGAQADTNHFNDTEPTNSVLSIGSTGTVNVNGSTYVGYAWAPVEGFSAFGTYTGNGSNDGAFVYTGFRIAFLLIKESSGSDAWIIWDNARQDFNAQGPYLQPQSNTTEGDADYVDFLSNGFKWRTTNGAMNASGSTYVYAAFAENPFQANGGLAR